MNRRTMRAQDITAGIVTTRGTVDSVERLQADIFRITFDDGTFRTCAWGGVFYLA